jgi:hypothetical protein
MRHLFLAILSAALLVGCTASGAGDTEPRTYEAQDGQWTWRVQISDSLAFTTIDSVDRPPSRQVVSCSYQVEAGTLSVGDCPHVALSRRGKADSLVAHMSFAPQSDSARMVAERAVRPFLEGAAVQDSAITAMIEDGGESQVLRFRRTE